MHYLNISFSHKNSSLEIREKLTYPDDKHKNGCLTKLNKSGAVNETMLISTCNRMEIFCSCNDIPTATTHIFEMLRDRAGLSLEELQGRADIYDDSSAIHHLFTVASSLDSMVVGETQIAGQLKDAFRYAYDNNFAGKKIARAIQKAFRCAAAVRNATNISSKPVSMASVAVAKLKSVVDDVKGKKVLVIGVGDMSEITAKNMIADGAEVFIMNRTLHRAETLANELGAKILAFEELSSAINECDIIFTATSSTQPIITDKIIKSCDFDRYWFDLALPRDISYSKGERINLYVIDDLKVIADGNKADRELEARKAHGIIGRSVVDFFEFLDTLNIEPLVKEVYEKAFEAANTESKRVINKGFIPKEYESQVKKLAEQTVKRFLHDITKNMRDVSHEAKNDKLSSVMQFMINNKKENI